MNYQEILDTSITQRIEDCLVAMDSAFSKSNCSGNIVENLKELKFGRPAASQQFLDKLIAVTPPDATVDDESILSIMIDNF
jgi:hypothetical protein